MPIVRWYSMLLLEYFEKALVPYKVSWLLLNYHEYTNYFKDNKCRIHILIPGRRCSGGCWLAYKKEEVQKRIYCTKCISNSTHMACYTMVNHNQARNKFQVKQIKFLSLHHIFKSLSFSFHFHQLLFILYFLHLAFF